MKVVRLTGRGALGVLVVTAVIIPTVALAVPGRTSGVPTSQSAHSAAQKSAGKSAPQGQPEANLRRRIANVLAARQRRFDAASGAIGAHIRRVEAIAAKVEAAGGDVTEARGLLGKATDALGAANTLEQAMVVELNAIPESSNRISTFGKASAEGRLAVAQLREARRDVVLAVQALRASVKSMASADSGASETH